MFAFVAETAKYTKLKDNVSMEGMIFSCSSVGIKIGSGLGTAVVGWFLSWGHYDGTLVAQSDSALKMISASYLLLPLITAILVLILFLPMNIEKVNHELEAKLSK